MKKISCLLMLGCAFAILAGEAPKKSKVDKAAAEMDYGPYLATTVGATDHNIAFKGVVISLNKEKSANVVFDTELLRLTAGWSDGYLNLASRAFADNNNDYTRLDGNIQISTGVTPGWSVDDKKDDPRPTHDGPIPREWAKYRGLYLNGDRTVICYTVADCRVLEAESAATADGIIGFARNFTLGPSTKPMSLLAFEIDKKDVVSGGVGSVGPQVGANKSGAAEGQIAVITTKEAATTAGAIGAPKGCEWEIDGGRVYLKIPPQAAPVSFKVVAAKTKIEDLSKFSGLLNGAAEDLTPLTKGGAERWKEKPVTKGTIAPDGDAPYVVDDIAAPVVNPYKSWLRFVGMDFFSDGRAALSTWNGDVWIVSGIDKDLQNVTWKRFATGLNQPLGLKIVDDVVYTVDRSQITRLVDLNNDGEADFYENVNNDCFLGTNFHEMCFDLQSDKDGNFYYSKGSAIWAGSLRMTPHHGSVIKVSKDGSQFEVLCSGLRAPNGVCVGPNGEITCSDNQGNWTPLCPINAIKKGAYYGFVGQGQEPKEREKPLCWIPYNMDKSTGTQLYCYSDKWGPFKGKMMSSSYDCGLLHILTDYSGEMPQGGAIRFPLSFPSGCMRARFNPVDGQLYVAALRGWSSRAAKECAFQRVRYTGKPAHMVYDAKVVKGGINVTFTEPLDSASAQDLQNIGAEWFNVQRSGGYGSSEFFVTDAKKKGREPLEIKSAKLLDDKKTIALEIPTLKECTNLVIKFKLKAADGGAVAQEMSYTINKMP